MNETTRINRVKEELSIMVPGATRVVAGKMVTKGKSGERYTVIGSVSLPLDEAAAKIISAK